MRRLFNPDIRQRLWIALGLLAASTVFAGGIAWYGLDRAGARMERLHRQTLVEVSHSIRLSRQSADVARSAPYLLNLQSTHLINKEERQLLETLKPAIGPWPNSAAPRGSPVYLYDEDIAATVHQMKIAIRDLAIAARQLSATRDDTLQIAAELTRFEERLYSFATDLEQPPERRQAWLEIQAMTNTLLAAAHAENLPGVGERQRTYQRIRRSFLTRSDARSFSIFLNRLEGIAKGENGLFELRRLGFNFNIDSQNALSRIRDHAEGISRLATQFAQSAGEYLSSEREETSTVIDFAKALVVIAGFASVTLALFSAVFVSSYVIGNIRAISGAMMRLAQGDRSTQLRRKVAGDDEIGKLLHSFRVFRANALRLDRSHRQLHQKNVQFEKIFANISDGVAITSETGHLTEVNPNIAQVLGLETGDLNGKPGIDAVLAKTGFAAQVAAAGIDADFRGLTEISNGEGRTLEIRCSRLPDGGGIWLISDITERREMENRLRQIRQIEKLGKVTGEVAHDFGNILSTITANLHLLEAGNDKGVDDKTLLQRITNATEIGTSLTQRLLAFARKQRLAPEIVELNDLVGGLGELLEIGLKEGVTLITEPVDEQLFVRLIPGSWKARS
jgi:PAS domain S-box-containing protein